MASLAQKLSSIVGQAFKDAELPDDLGSVKVSDRPDLAQFQCNGAMAAAKIAKKNPRDIADDIVQKITANENVDHADIAGPGFINLNVSDDFLQTHLAEIASDDHFGVSAYSNKEKVVLDYGGPNIAKPMHVGHLRASIIGESLRRVCLFAGFDALGDVHMGDWGTHMGMIISEYILTGEAERVLKTDLSDSESVDTLMAELSDMYPKVSAACKEDEERKILAQEATVKIQNKDPQHYDLWKVIREASVQSMKRNFKALNVHFDLWKGEADVHDYIEPMVDDLKSDSWAVQDDGAWIIPVKENDDNKEIPPLILYKRDGAVMYGTTDLATIVERMKLYDPARMIYIVDQRQHLHFVQVFRAAKKSGITPAATELTHAGFGTMNGTDGKPFKTRAGGVMRLEDLIEMGTTKAMERLSEANLAADMSEQEKQDIAHKIGIAAIKFADLQNPRISDYVFDLDKFMSFEGKTGPYLLYQVVRIGSLLRKAEDQGESFEEGQFKITDGDRSLALMLCEFPDYFDASLRNYMPHHLCEYAYKLASTFSSFYGTCHILSEDDEAVKQSRLALAALTKRQLEQCLALLGIEVPARM